jgi:RNA polymerase sigma-70 factor (ECF subfamily)
MEATPDLRTATDESLAQMVQGGSHQAFEILIERFGEKMTRYAKRFFSDKEDVEDLVQDVFLKVYVNINSYDAKQRFSPWIYRIAHNTFVNKIAWKSIRKLVSIDADEIFAPTLVAPENVERESIRREEREQMEVHLEKLDRKYKDPLLLFFYEELSYEEIADILKIPTNTVGIRILRGKEKLKKILTQN